MEADSLYTDRTRIFGLSFREHLRDTTRTLPSFAGSSTSPLPRKTAPVKQVRETAFRIAHESALPSRRFGSRLPLLTRFHVFACRLPRFNPAALIACGVSDSSANASRANFVVVDLNVPVVGFMYFNTKSTSLTWNERGRANLETACSAFCFYLQHLTKLTKFYARTLFTYLTRISY